MNVTTCPQCGSTHVWFEGQYAVGPAHEQCQVFVCMACQARFAVGPAWIDKQGTIRHESEAPSEADREWFRWLLGRAVARLRRGW